MFDDDSSDDNFSIEKCLKEAKICIESYSVSIKECKYKKAFKLKECFKHNVNKRAGCLLKAYNSSQTLLKNAVVLTISLVLLF